MEKIGIPNESMRKGRGHSGSVWTNLDKCLSSPSKEDPVTECIAFTVFCPCPLSAPAFTIELGESEDDRVILLDWLALASEVGATVGRLFLPL